MNADELRKKNLICKVMSGSRAYGTNIETSDTDMRGIFCADPINLLTPFFPVREVEDATEEDTKYYELAHFVKLLVDQNPNIVELLWVREEDVLTRTPAYDYLRAHRTDFLSSKIAFTTSGYAYAQLKRIKGHNKWIMNPQPVEAPQEREYIHLVQWFGEGKMLKNAFDITDYENTHRAITYGNKLYGLYEMDGGLFRPDGSLKVNFDGEREKLVPPLAIIKLDRENWQVAKETHSNYWDWKNNRNAVRSALEIEHGYDTKHAMHLVRLLRTGYEALTTGEISVFRPDSTELLEIRDGSMTYDELLAYAEVMDKKIKDAYNVTKLPKRVNIKRAAKHILKAQQLTWNKDGNT